ncbi:MAG: hypothetical protein U9R43_16405, partial [Thermodesulfobacteriota bacterium]|nr:hypothetical protein [Thermodesulfobacteriota bacterium]
TVIFGLYFKKVFSLAAILSIVCGEIVLMCFYFKLFMTNTFLPVIWVMIITFSVYLITHMLLLWRKKALYIRMPEWLYDWHVWLFFVIFLFAMDFWAWGKVEPIFFGIPLWVGYFVILSALQTIVMVYLINKKVKVHRF